MELNASEIGQNIKIQRIRAGVTQETLAEMLDISAQQISNYERGHNLVSLTRLVELSLYFQVDINVLLGQNYSAVPEKILREDIEDIVDALSADDLKIWVNMGRAFVEQRRNEQKEKQVAGQENV